MNHIELEAARRRLFYSQTEAAALVGHVSDRSWRKWEAGTVPVPSDVEERLQALLKWRETAVSGLRRTIAEARTALANDALEISLVWYSSSDDWLTIPNRERALRHPHCSALAEIYATERGVRLVAFDGLAYRSWLGSRADNEFARSGWAATRP